MQGASTRHVAGAQHHIGLIQRLAQGRQATGVVREVGVHREDLLVALGQGVVESHEVGGTQAQLAGSVQHAHPARETLCEPLCHFSGPIR